MTASRLSGVDGGPLAHRSDPHAAAPGWTPPPPAVVSPDDYPQVPPPGGATPAAGIGAPVAIVSGLAIGAIAVLGHLSAGAATLEALLFFPVVATAWWAGRRAALVMAVLAIGGLVVPTWTLGHPFTPWTVASAAAVATALALFAVGVADVHSRLRVLLGDEAKRRTALGLLALQLRESVVSIDVAVPLLADPTTLDRAQGAAFDQVRRHARGLSRVANDLLAVDHLETRKLQLSLVSLDLAAFVLEITRQRITHDRATILAPSTPVEVQADPERLRQVLEHLLANALKFSAPGSGIMVNVSADASTARVAVTDHGVGLSAEDKKILFTRYGRIRDTRTAHVPGIGLGLYLSKLIAVAHGGDLIAESPGRGLGATFSLIVPLAGRVRRPAPDVPASSFWD